MSDIRYRHWISSMGRKSAASVHQLKTLPPTSEAFVENVKRAPFQACIWRSALTGEAPDMDPLENSWVSDNDFGVLMPLTLPPQTEIAPAAVMKLIQRDCSSETPCSTERCGCVAGQMSCSAFYRCRAEIRTCRNRWTLLKQRIEDEDESETGQRGRSDYRSSSGGGTWMSGLRMRWEAFPEVGGCLALQEVVLECKGGGDLAVITGDVHSALADFLKAGKAEAETV
ncbi:hypothetical protein GWK47_008433 [Chionoecetes opilio]|uniref:Uncharacterized protein n=1 Tax=Chionoecetes opilio TaxID=41210 RepID=A0A8J4Y3Q3_CHIOP|nr:hypothetical protein GWK47_008433 [Chionoecetes opilio]